MKRLAFLAILLVGCGGPTTPPEAASDEPTPVAVELATAKRSDVQETLAVDGSLVMPEGASSKLASAVAGKLFEVRVKEGDHVVAGQLLARIDTRSLVAQSESAVTGAAAASATAVQGDLALQAAREEQKSALQAARLAVGVAVAEGKANVEQAEIELQRLRAGARPQEIAQAQQAYEQARIARDKAKADADRDALLLKEGLVAASEAEVSRAAWQTAESALQSAQSALELVRAGNRSEDIQASALRLASARKLAAKLVDQAQAQLRLAEAGRLTIAAKTQEVVASRLAAQQKVADARVAAIGVATGEIRSPMSGYVVRRYLNVGDSVDPTTPVLAISAVNPSADFVGGLSASEGRRVLPGMVLTAEGMTGFVTAIGEADPATGLIPIRAHLRRQARAGGFVTARIVLATIKGATVIPKGAVLSRDGKDVVFVAKDGAAHLTEVEIGPEQDAMVAIRHGISPGDTVVVLGGHELSDGQKIEAAKEK